MQNIKLLIVQIRRGSAWACVTAACFGLVFSPPLFAQEESGEQGVLEEIIVTAQKREQNLQTLSISVTALDEEAINRAGITDISRIELVSPGVTYAFIGHDAKINIRGAN